VDLHGGGERRPKPEGGLGRPPPLQQHEIHVREPPQRAGDFNDEHPRRSARTCASSALSPRRPLLRALQPQQLVIKVVFLLPLPSSLSPC
jgi:hypothetical protein